MNYANPNFQMVFAALSVLLLFYVWTVRRRKALTERFADKNLIAGIAPSISPLRRAVKVALLVAAAALGLLALARPQWGFEWEEVKRAGLDILIAQDVSRSMLARDMKPNRLERSKFAIKDLVKRLNGDRIGLIAFAGTSFLQCPLTIDYNGFLLSLEDLNTDTIPRGGTSIESAIDEAMRTFTGTDKKYKVLLIITDGEELEGDAKSKALAAAEAGIKIYCVGVGTAEGDIIPDLDGSGERGYLEDRSGNVVKTRLNEDILKAIAISTGGSYVRATASEFGVTLLYDKSISRLEKRDIDSKMEKRYEERFQVFIAFALLFLFLEPMISERRKVAR
ncbi:MAG: VWA domain-containing protein [Candidatus Omnitrophota bacterium]